MSRRYANVQRGVQGFVVIPVAERLALYSEKVGECLEWRSWVDNGGYGRITVSRRNYAAHRVAYEVANGPIPDGLTIDHLCRNRKCINPDHLEAVSMRENILRSDSPPSLNARKTHCSNGHPLAGDNLRKWNLNNGGQRVCLTCTRERQKANKAERRRKLWAQGLTDRGTPRKHYYPVAAIARATGETK
jgi:hypothetical protein